MKAIFLFILFSFNVINAQKVSIGIGSGAYSRDDFSEAIIHFNDGTSIAGIGRLNMIATSREDIIEFKVSEEDKADQWRADEVKGITIVFDEKVVQFEFLKVSKYSFSEIYEVITEGSVKLYRNRKNKFSPTSSMNSDGSIQSSGGNSKRNIYYMKRESEEFPTRIKDNYIKSTTEYMKDCPVIVDKIKNHEYNYSQIPELVDYYNANCGE